MALVLRKAVLSKNAPFLKCMKGRHFVSSASKKNPVLATAACPRRRFREKSMLCGLVWKTETAKRPKCTRSRVKTSKNLRTRCCFSCPQLAARAQRPPARHYSPPARVSSLPFAFSNPSGLQPLVTRNLSTKAYSAAERSARNLSTRPQAERALPATNKLVPYQPKAPVQSQKRLYTCKCGCGCPFPCGPFGNCCGCGCLPPPCNTPPRCIQYMTGYYYYPYGFWFCGPYHVTGLCCPVSGSCPCGCGCCGCGCGPCGKCCACCVVPDIAGAALAAAVPGIAAPQSTKRVSQTQLGRGYPIQESKENSSRMSINKFFPFSTAVTPSVHGTKPSSKKIAQGSANKKKVAGNKMPGTRSYSTVANFEQADLRFDKRGPYSCTMKPRKIPTAEERDQPNIYPGQFHLGFVPKYKNPHPNHKSLDDNSIKVA